MLRFFYMDASCCISYAVAEAIKAGSVSQAQGGSPLEPSPAGKSLALLGAAVKCSCTNATLPPAWLETLLSPRDDRRWTKASSYSASRKAAEPCVLSVTCAFDTHRMWIIHEARIQSNIRAVIARVEEAACQRELPAAALSVFVAESRASPAVLLYHTSGPA